MVLPHSHRIPRVLWYSGYRLPNSRFDYKTVTFFGAAFCLLRLHSFDAFRGPYPLPYFYGQVWALSLSLTTTQKIVFLLSFPPGT